MNFADLVDLRNPQAFFISFSFVLCLLSMIMGAKVKNFFYEGKIPQSILLLIINFVIAGIAGNYGYSYLERLIRIPN